MQSRQKTPLEILQDALGQPRANRQAPSRPADNPIVSKVLSAINQANRQQSKPPSKPSSKSSSKSSSKPSSRAPIANPGGNPVIESLNVALSQDKNPMMAKVQTPASGRIVKMPSGRAYVIQGEVTQSKIDQTAAYDEFLEQRQRSELLRTNPAQWLQRQMGQPSAQDPFVDAAINRQVAEEGPNELFYRRKAEEANRILSMPPQERFVYDWLRQRRRADSLDQLYQPSQRAAIEGHEDEFSYLSNEELSQLVRDYWSTFNQSGGRKGISPRNTQDLRFLQNMINTLRQRSFVHETPFALPDWLVNAATDLEIMLHSNTQDEGAVSPMERVGAGINFGTALLGALTLGKKDLVIDPAWAGIKWAWGAGKRAVSSARLASAAKRAGVSRQAFKKILQSGPETEQEVQALVDAGVLRESKTPDQATEIPQQKPAGTKEVSGEVQGEPSVEAPVETVRPRLAEPVEAPKETPPVEAPKETPPPAGPTEKPAPARTAKKVSKKPEPAAEPQPAVAPSEAPKPAEKVEAPKKAKPVKKAEAPEPAEAPRPAETPQAVEAPKKAKPVKKVEPSGKSGEEVKRAEPAGKSTVDLDDDDLAALRGKSAVPTFEQYLAENSIPANSSGKAKKEYGALVRAAVDRGESVSPEALKIAEETGYVAGQSENAAGTASKPTAKPAAKQIAKPAKKTAASPVGEPVAAEQVAKPAKRAKPVEKAEVPEPVETPQAPKPAKKAKPTEKAEAPKPVEATPEKVAGKAAKAPKAASGPTVEPKAPVATQTKASVKITTPNEFTDHVAKIRKTMHAMMDRRDSLPAGTPEKVVLELDSKIKSARRVLDKATSDYSTFMANRNKAVFETLQRLSKAEDGDSAVRQAFNKTIANSTGDETVRELVQNALKEHARLKKAAAKAELKKAGKEIIDAASRSNAGASLFGADVLAKMLVESPKFVRAAAKAVYWGVVGLAGRRVTTKSVLKAVSEKYGSDIAKNIEPYADELIKWAKKAVSDNSGVDGMLDGIKSATSKPRPKTMKSDDDIMGAIAADADEIYGSARRLRDVETPKAEVLSPQQYADMGKSLWKKRGIEGIKKVRQKVLSGKPVDTNDAVLLSHYIADLRINRQAGLAEVMAINGRTMPIEDALMMAYNLATEIGGQWSNLGRAMQAAFTKDYSPTTISALVKRALGRGKVAPNQAKEYTEAAMKLAKEHDQVEKRIVDLSEEMKTAKPSPQKSSSIKAPRASKEKIERIEKEQQKILRGMLDKLSGAFSGIPPELFADVAKLVKLQFQKGGVTFREAAEAARELLSQNGLRYDLDDVVDAASGYSDAKLGNRAIRTPSEYEIAKREAFLKSQLKDLEEGKELPKAPRQPKPQNIKNLEDKIKEIREQRVTLKEKIAKREASLERQIEAIKSGKVKPSGPPVTSAKIRQLEAKRRELIEAAKTKEQKIEELERRLEAQLKRAKSGAKRTPRPVDPEITSPKIEAIRKELDEIRQSRGMTEAEWNARSLERVNEDIKTYEDWIAKNQGVAPEKRGPAPTLQRRRTRFEVSAELQQAYRHRARLRRQIDRLLSDAAHPPSLIEKFTRYHRELQLANLYARFRDVKSNLGNVVKPFVGSTGDAIAKVILKVAKENPNLVSVGIADPAYHARKLAYVMRGAKERWGQEFVDAMGGYDDFLGMKYDNTGYISRFAGALDTPFRDFHQRMFAYDIANAHVAKHGGNFDDVFHQILAPQMDGPLSKSVAMDYFDQANEWGLYQTYNNPTVVSEVIGFVRSSIRNLKKSINENDNKVVNGIFDTIDFVYDTLTRYSKVLTNVAADKTTWTNPTFAVVRAGLQAHFSLGKYGKIRAVTAKKMGDMIAKGMYGSLFTAMGAAAAREYLSDEEPKDPKRFVQFGGMVKTAKYDGNLRQGGGTVYIQEGYWGRIDGLLTAFIRGYHQELISEGHRRGFISDSQRKEMERDLAWFRTLTDIPVVGNIVRAFQRRQEEEQFLVKSVASGLPIGHLREWAERRDIMRNAQPRRKPRDYESIPSKEFVDYIIDVVKIRYPWARETVRPGTDEVFPRVQLQQ